MKKAFTLIELLVVIGIMGLLGTASVGGYRAMQRGMAERGVMENVNAFVRAAYQRAQIDRQPTAIYFWNETMRGDASEDLPGIVVGKAVAIRRHGRITEVKGDYLYDEFADLNLSYQTADAAASSAAGEGAGDSRKNTMYLYPLDRLSDNESKVLRAIVDQKVVGRPLTPYYLSGKDGGALPNDAAYYNDGIGSSLASDEKDGQMKVYAFKVADAGGVAWKVGMAYGFEFARLELPHGFVFGSPSLSSLFNVKNPMHWVGTLTFDVGRNEGNGVSGESVKSITVSELLPDKKGELSVRTVGKSATNLAKDLN